MDKIVRPKGQVNVPVRVDTWEELERFRRTQKLTWDETVRRLLEASKKEVRP